MMPVYPFFSPYNYKTNYNSPHHSKANFTKRPIQNCYSPSRILNNNINTKKNTINCKEPKNFNSNSMGSKFSRAKHEDFNDKNQETNNIEEDREYNQFFELFGIRLYFDDLLILALLFFLYKEESQDSYLYIILIMLLLS